MSNFIMKEIIEMKQMNNKKAFIIQSTNIKYSISIIMLYLEMT